jgi:pimeloyl-ACP methyl ester carboxylesterase
MRARVFHPPVQPKATLLLLPGGSYDHRYWCFDAVDGYNAAEYFAGEGFLVVAADHLGVGLSDKPADADAVTLTSMADAAAAIAKAVASDLSPDGEVIGVGHSIGGCVTTMAQARHGCFSRIVNLGYTHGEKSAVTVDANATDARSAAVEQAQAFFSDWDAGYCLAPREPSHAWLYTPSVPADLIRHDDETLVPWPRQAYVDALTDGFSAPFAAEVRCPVLLVFGSNDIPQYPHRDISYYSASPDVTVSVPDDTAHCHNFSSNRRALWARMGSWFTDRSLVEHN